MTLTHSDQIDQIATALSQAQGAMRGALKDATNPHFRSRYADLASVWDACREPLSKAGIAVVQSPGAEGPVVRMDTILMHTSGQWIRGTATCEAKDGGPQAVGSAITYLRRYTLQSFCGIAPEDDDAEAAEGRKQSKPPTPDGYTEWRSAMTKTAKSGKGLGVLETAWKASPEEYRRHMLAKERDYLDELKQIAGATEADA